MIKSELRNIYKSKRRALSQEAVDDLSLQIANRLLQLNIWDVSFYHVFLSITEQNEVNSDYLLNILSGKDKHIVVSKSDFKTYSMSHYLLTDNTAIKKNKYNIPEPIDGIEIPIEKIDVVFIPLLAFDKQGNRVGYGKGFYDVFLSQCRPDVVKIGLSFFEAEKYIEGIIDTDMPLDYCVTPNETYKF